MSYRVVRRAGFSLIVALGAASCASVARMPPIDRPAGLAVTRLADLRLPRGTECIVHLAGGETVRGKLKEVTHARLEIRDAGSDTDRSIVHADIVLVAKLVKMSKGVRGRLGAAIGAVASLPLAISMFGDMMIPAAIVGALIGRSTGDSRAQVVFERPVIQPES